MRRLIYSVSILLIGINFINAQKPEIVNTIVKDKKPHSLYVRQA